MYLQFQNTNNKSNCISSTERLAWMERYAQRDTSNHCLVLPRSHPRLSLLPSTLCVSLSLVRARALSLHTVSRQSLFSLSFYIFLMCTHQSEDGAVSWRSNTSSRSNATNVSGPMEVSTGACVKERERERLCSYWFISTHMLACTHSKIYNTGMCIHALTHTLMHTHAHMQIHTHAYHIIYLPINQLTHTHAHGHKRAHMHTVHMHAGTHARIQCPSWQEKALEYKHTYIHTYVHTHLQT